MSNPVDRARDLARDIRRTSLVMVHEAGASHIGSCLSAADILASIYESWLRVDPQSPDAPDRDIFILSKGHAAAALYATLALRGFFPQEWLSEYCGNGALLSGHATHKGVPGVEVSTGSLGHGLSFALGFALAAKRQGPMRRVVTLLSDGECDEGSTWEAALLAPQHKVANLTAIVDYNKIQSLNDTAKVIDLEPLHEKFRAFGWHVLRLDGHDHDALAAALAEADAETERPTCLVCDTVKGKGVSFMEGDLLWHYRPPGVEQLAQALEEVEQS